MINRMPPQLTVMFFLTLILLTNVYLVMYFKTSPSDQIPQESRETCPESLTNKIGRVFLPIITEEKKTLINALVAFKEAVHSNVTYFMDAGTLLGSYRHHGFIPWDIDIDFMVKKKDRDVLKECLGSLKPKFELFTKSGEIWRFYRNDSLRTASGWAWLHVDIFFFEENTSQVWRTDNIHLKYAKNDVLPLIERPFMGMMLPAPRNTPLVLSRKYDVNMCRNNNNIETDPCNLLKDRIPFVNREQHSTRRMYMKLFRF